MRNLKRFFLWFICYILSSACLIMTFPIVLFTLYPYSIITVAFYAMAMVVLSVISFRNNAIEHTIIKRILFGMLLMPIIALLTILVSIETGWLHYPG